MKLHSEMHRTMIEDMASIGAVLLADVVSSREARAFRETRDRALREVSAAHTKAGWTDGPYAVTAWDEFQVIVVKPSSVPPAVWSLRRAFHPLRLRVGIGVGRIERGSPGQAPVNLDATGPAFVRARAALEAVGRDRNPRYAPLTEARTGSQRLDCVAGALLHLADLLTARITDTQWQAIAAVEQYGRQTRAAAELGKDESTVSRALKHASYSHLLAALDALGIVLESAAGEGATL